MIMAVASVFALSNNNTSVSLAIVNSYSGTLTLLPHSGTWLIDTDGRWWTDQWQARLQVSSNDSSYVLSGDMIWSSLTWSHTGLYNDEYVVDLTTGQVQHDFVVDFLKWSEPLRTPTITIMVDDQAPTMSDLLIANNTTITGDIAFMWSAVTDTGVWIMNYTLLVGLTPSIGSMVAIVTTGTSLTIPSSMMPDGTIYWTVIATDRLGQQSDYVMWYVHHGLPTATEPGAIWSFGWAWYRPDEQDVYHYVDDTKWPNTWSWQDINLDDLPVYIPSPDGDYQEYRSSCRGLRVDTLIQCHEWDALLFTHSSAPIRSYSGIVCDNLPEWIVWVGEINVGQDAENFINSISVPLIFRPLNPDQQLSNQMYQRYFAQQPAWWVLPRTWVDRALLESQPEPDYRDYESVLKQYGEHYIPRTREFTWYIVLITVGLVWCTRWFFRGGYHHRYVIKYLK